MEEFYSIQGEGYNTGQAAYFIRIGGCDVGCQWCDVKESWNANLHPLVKTEEIVERAASYPAKAVVITGGEPTLYNLEMLCLGLAEREISIFLETSGSNEFVGNFDWICLSPKQKSLPVASAYTKADELKVIISKGEDLEWAAEQAKKVNPDCMLYLQAEWSVSEKVMPLIVDFILENPQWHISLQSHKYMRIP
ncbi:MAG TPA: 7-carboxy-7-deazaguanine synthase QueE [Bacteroidales bacterium]|nr:7-carboxy-7-deazaguanine synthase QueE [Bacteroidales bacterium]